MRHAFVDSGTTVSDRAGRTLRVCSECGKARIGSGHAVDPLPSILPNVFAGKAALPPREVRMLALALDAVLALPIDTVGWRVNLRANDLRSALDIPREIEPQQIQVPQPVPDMPVARTHTAPVRARARAGTKSIRNEQMRAVATRAIEHGWKLANTGSGHMRLEKEGKSLIFSATASDHRAWKNFRALAKRHGINVEDI